MFRREPDRFTPLAIALGAAAGATAAAYGVFQAVRAMRRRRDEMDTDESLDALEESAVDALRRDPVTGSCAIDVAALAPGIVELTGMVPTQEARQRAGRVLHALPGVRTVINRLEIGAFRRRAEQYQARESAGDPAVREQHWTGIGSGMGTRRQGDTDPDRPDDSQHSIERELELSERDIAEAEEDAGIRG